MNIDIRLSINFYDHHKTIRLKKKLGFEAIEALHRLWFFAAESRPDGILRNMDAEDIATVSRWQGDAEVFINALSDEKYPWLDKINGCYCLHNWKKRNGYVAHSEARSNKARLAAQARWEKHNNSKNQQDNAKCINEQCNENAQSNAPSPAPNPFPNPNPKKKKKRKKEKETLSFQNWETFVDKVFDVILNNTDWIKEQEGDYPFVDIRKTITKAKEYWRSREGYDKKKGNPDANWKSTLYRAFSSKWLIVPKILANQPRKQRKKDIGSSDFDDPRYEKYLQFLDTQVKNYLSNSDKDLIARFRKESEEKIFAEIPDFKEAYPDWEERIKRHIEPIFYGKLVKHLGLPKFSRWKNDHQHA